MANGLARAFRNAPTSAEYKLWPLLRRKNLWGLRIRRQVPMGPYIADFVCFPALLVIEIDGDTHASTDAQSRDEERTASLTVRGFAVIRFWNNDVYADASAVADAIADAIQLRMAALGRPLPSRV